MPRWEPDARERLVAAALHLFAEQGYDATTVAQIAERAGLTKSTFHRHFPDKRDVLAAGQETLCALLAEGIAAAPPGAAPLDAVSAGLSRAAAAFRPELAARIAAVVAASRELTDRAVLKQAGLAAAMAAALRDRGVAAPLARLAAELGSVALAEAFAAWAAGDGAQDLGALTAAELARLRSAAAQL